MPDSDSVELIPLNEQDEAIYSAWETGKGLRTLAREFGLSVAQIEQALDRTLPAFDGAHQLRAFKRELRRLEDLSSEFYALAKRDANRGHDSAHLYARLNERVCAMRGWSPVNVRIGTDPMATQAGQLHLGSVELSPTFNNAFTLRDRVGELTAGARAIVAAWTEPGTLVVVTHGANILPLTGVTPEEAGMVIVKPDPGSAAKLRTLGRIPPLPLGP